MVCSGEMRKKKKTSAEQKTFRINQVSKWLQGTTRRGGGSLAFWEDLASSALIYQPTSVTAASQLRPALRLKPLSTRLWMGPAFHLHVFLCNPSGRQQERGGHVCYTFCLHEAVQGTQVENHFYLSLPRWEPSSARFKRAKRAVFPDRIV